MAISMKQKLGEMLVDEGIITHDHLDQALKEQKANGGRIEQILVKMGFISEEVIMAFLGNQMSIPTVKIADMGNIDAEIIKMVSQNFAQRQILVPVSKEGNKLKVAMADPLNVSAIDDVKMMTGLEIEPVLASEDEIKATIAKAYSADTSAEMEEALHDLDVEDHQVDVLETGDDDESAAAAAKDGEKAPVIKIVNLILNQAVKEGASDIHIEPGEKESRVRFRIDGVLHEKQVLPKKFHGPLVSRIKIIGEMDIGERRKPQDGRIKLKLLGREIDMRVSCLPVVFGEKLVIRIADSTALQLDLAKLGFEPDILQVYKKNIEAPYGIILVTGPTGSGKTVTLYSTLGLLNYPDDNLSTIEDPVEILIEGVTQVQANPKAGLTFAAGLRSFLRQDPDIIMVGEIRDGETASIAINAALTGHLVLSTLHTTDAPGAITRLDNMGIEPFLITSSVIMVISQRLVRKLCPKCKEAYEVAPEILEEMQFKVKPGEKIIFYKPKGCEHCAKTGYKGRVGIYEVMTMNEPIQKGILARQSADDLKKIAIETGMVTLRQAGIRKIRQGVTSIEEILRATKAD